MKKINFLLLMAIPMILAGCESRPMVLPAEKLPAPAKEFVSKYVPDASIKLVIKDENEYKVDLDNGWKIEFNRKGEWIDIDTFCDGLPESMNEILPSAMLETLRTQFFDAAIYQIQKDGNKFETDLDTGHEVEFDKKGRILDIS